MTTKRNLIAQMIVHAPIWFEDATEEESLVLAGIYTMQKRKMDITPETVTEYMMETRLEGETDYAKWIRELLDEYDASLTDS